MALRTGAHLFEDESKSNILAVLSGAFMFVIPGTKSEPLLCLELFLDSQCVCSTNPRTSPDLRDVEAAFGPDAMVDIETQGRGFQLLKGVKNAMKTAELFFPTEDDGEEYAACATELLGTLPPLPLRERDSNLFQLSSHHKSQYSRRLDSRMVDMSVDSDTTSESDTDSIMNPPLYMDRDRSRSRQSARRTEAKLQEAHRNMRSKPASFPLQESLILGGLGQDEAEPQGVDPRVLQIRDDGISLDKPTRDSRIASISVYAGSDTGVDDADQMAKSTPRHARPPILDHQCPSEDAKTLPTEKEEHRQRVTGHRRKPSIEPNAANTPLAPTETQARMATFQPLLQRPRESQKSTTNLMDWDVGEMAGKDSATPLTKKQRLKKPAAKPAKRKSQDSSKDEEISIQSGNNIGQPTLKRSKLVAGKTQKGNSLSLDQYDFEIDDDEVTAPTLKSNKAVTKRPAKAANKKIESQSSKISKKATPKQGINSRTALKPVDLNITSLAATRSRRAPPKSKKYVLDSETEDEEKDNEQNVIRENHMPRKEKATKTINVAAARISKSLTRDNADTEAGDMVIDDSVDDAEQLYDVDQPKEITKTVKETVEVSTTHETLVIASPQQTEQLGRQEKSHDSKDADILMSKRKSDARVIEDATEAPHDSSETAEDSYPMAASAITGPRISFGGKLGHLIQTAPAKKEPKIRAANKTPLSKWKSFVGAVNGTRSASPKKKLKDAPAKYDKDDTWVDDTYSATSGITNLKDENGFVRKSKINATNDEDGHIAFADLKGDIARSRPARGTTQEFLIGRTKVADVGSISMAHQSETAVPEALRSHADGEVRTPKDPVPGPRTAKIRLQDHDIEVVSSQEQKEGGGRPKAPPPKILSSRSTAAPRKQHQGFVATNSLPKMKPAERRQREVRPVRRDHLIDLIQDFDGDISPLRSTCFNLSVRGETSVGNEEITVAAKTAAPKASLGVSRRTFEPSKAATHAPEAKSPTAKQTRTIETPQATRAQVPRPKVLAETCLLPKTDTATTREINVQKKPQIVQFGQDGPQNQGIPSPDRQSCKSAAASNPPLNTDEHHGYKQQRPVAPVPHAFVDAPRLGPVLADIADQGNSDNQGIVFADDEFMQDVVAPAHDEPSGSYSKESAPSTLPHLPAERITTSRSTSQHSRVDQNGRPRLRPEKYAIYSRFNVSDLSTLPYTNNHTELNQGVISTPTEGSPSSEPASQDSEPSFHLERAAPLQGQSNRTTRTSAKTAAIAVASFPEKAERLSRRSEAVAMKAFKDPRESLGLMQMTKEQYPAAEENITTNVFKKPALKTAVAQTLHISPKVLVSNEKPKRLASISQIKPLQKSTNIKRRVQPARSSPALTKKVFSASPARVTKPGRTRSLGHQNAPATSVPLHPSLKTSLSVKLKQPSKAVEKESTILENLNRGKSAHRDVQDADRTLVEDDERPAHRRKISPDSFTESNPERHETERHVSLLKDKTMWQKGSREAQTNISDALMDITNVRL